MPLAGPRIHGLDASRHAQICSDDLPEGAWPDPFRMNLPNKLTVSRLVLTLAFLFALLIEFPWHNTVALLLFSAASITDWLDGAIARSRNLITDFGKLMDPLADKILVCSAFIAFIQPGYIAAWIVILIVARELAITGLRLLAASKNVVLAAEGYGKHKTIWQLITIIAILASVSHPEQGLVGQVIFGWPLLGKPWVAQLVVISTWITVALTLLSGWLYVWRNRRLFLSDM